MKYPIIHLELPEAVYGYWDGGKKQTFDFSPSPRHFVENGTTQWGSFGANFWFNCGNGKSWKTAVNYAIRRLAKLSRHKIKLVEIKWEEVDDNDY
jgi:hypothetical protein